MLGFVVVSTNIRTWAWSAMNNQATSPWLDLTVHVWRFRLGKKSTVIVAEFKVHSEQWSRDPKALNERPRSYSHLRTEDSPSRRPISVSPIVHEPLYIAPIESVQPLVGIEGAPEPTSSSIEEISTHEQDDFSDPVSTEVGTTFLDPLSSSLQHLCLNPSQRHPPRKLLKTVYQG